MRPHRIYLSVLGVAMILVAGQAAYAQVAVQKADLEIEGMVWMDCQRTAE